MIAIGGVSLLSAQTNLFQLRSELQKPMESSTTAVQEQSVHRNKKSPATAVLYSLLVPGMGELYADGFDQGKYSLIAEGGLWLTYFSFLQYGAWIRDDSRQFAAAHAGVTVAGKSDQYFVDIGNYSDTYEYNDYELIQRAPNKVYDVNAGYFWKWDSDESKKEFRAMRVSSERVFNNAKFVIGAVMINHIISAVNAARLTRQYNKQLEEGLGSWWLESSLLTNGIKPDGITLSVVHRF